MVTAGAARRELEDLRAAINHYRREGLCSEVVSVVLPSRPPARERWLTRSEADAGPMDCWPHLRQNVFRANTANTNIRKRLDVRS